MQQADSWPEGNAIDPDTVCISCGQDSSPDTMVICDGCNQGFHLACFGMSHVPETETWHCPGCSTLQQLQVGSTVVIEATQLLYKGSTEPHHTQGLFLATISSLGPMQQDGSGSYREVYVRSNRAPLQASVRYYSKTLPYKALQRVPLQSQQLATQLMQQPGTEELNIILSSSHYGMFGSAAASVVLSDEGWLAGPDCAADALRILAGPARQTYICNSSSSSSSKSAASRGRLRALHNQSASSTVQTPAQLAPQPAAPAAQQDDRRCIGCKTIVPGRPMQHCAACSMWSCLAPCRGASAGPAAAGGRPKRQGAGLQWSCPNPMCASPASHSCSVEPQQLHDDALAEEAEPSDDPTAPQEPPSSPTPADPNHQQPSLPPQAPVMSAPMSPPGLAFVPQNIPAY
jgi:hypothetical protein